MGALLEFRARLRELVAAGENYEAALLWGSALELQHLPCVEVGCQRCREGRGGFRFAFIGTYAGALWSLPPVLLRRHFIAMTYCEATDVLDLASGIWPTDILPDHTNRLLRHVETQRHPWGSTPEQLWVVWRDWQQGPRVWREPGYEAVPSWAEGRLHTCEGPSCPLVPPECAAFRDGGASRSLPQLWVPVSFAV